MGQVFSSFDMRKLLGIVVSTPRTTAAIFKRNHFDFGFTGEIAYLLTMSIQAERKVTGRDGTAVT